MLDAKITTWARDGVALSALRQAVFVTEQGVPAEIEFDTIDAMPKRTAHAVLRDAAGAVIATGRLVLTRDASVTLSTATSAASAGSLVTPRIGRMAVKREARGQGAGGRVLHALAAHAQRLGYTDVLLHAQAHAASFYALHGFVQFGASFTEADILHVEMRKKLI